MKYRVGKAEQLIIVQNLIDILEKDSEILYETRRFIGNWLSTTHEEKSKSYYDTWELVLKNYLPTERPVLFRSTNRIYKNDRISSFTSSLEALERFANNKGYVIVCDTSESLEYEEKIFKKGSYQNSFYPLIKVLQKIKDIEGDEFYSGLFSRYFGESEYVMKTNFNHMSILKYCKK